MDELVAIGLRAHPVAELKVLDLDDGDLGQLDLT
jgi:hypothetical protein